MKKKAEEPMRLIGRISGLKKLVFCLALALLVFGILSAFGIKLMTRVILGWNTFALSMIILSWILFFSTSSKALKSVVEKQDEGLKAIFLIVIVAVSFSVFGTIALLIGKEQPDSNKILHTIIAMSPVFLSWFLLHSIFTIRYAHLYNDHNKLNTGSDIGGINFPSDSEPDYVDFAYFSFVIGMTFQVSDAAINSKVIRRFVLLHSIISFIFNTIIVALTINTISNLNS